MNNLSEYILEKLKLNKDISTKERTDIDDEIEEWENRMKEPFGKTLKELQCAIIDSGLYTTSTNEYGLNVYTPFDNYITAYAIDGNKEYTYNKIKLSCSDWDFTSLASVQKILKKLKGLL